MLRRRAPRGAVRVHTGVTPTAGTARPQQCPWGEGHGQLPATLVLPALSHRHPLRMEALPSALGATRALQLVGTVAQGQRAVPCQRLSAEMGKDADGSPVGAGSLGSAGPAPGGCGHPAPSPWGCRSGAASRGGAVPSSPGECAGQPLAGGTARAQGLQAQPHGTGTAPALGRQPGWQQVLRDLLRHRRTSGACRRLPATSRHRPCSGLRPVLPALTPPPAPAMCLGPLRGDSMGLGTCHP